MYHSKYRVREMIEYRFRVSSATVFTLYSYSKALEYRFRVSTAASLRNGSDISFFQLAARTIMTGGPSLDLLPPAVA
jgi:hypothetical protein